MTESTNLIVPILREMRAKIDEGQAENQKEFKNVKSRLDNIDQRQKGFSHALSADSLMSKMIIGDWEERIEALEKKMKKLEARK
jgi:archaellum component FlaC